MILAIDLGMKKAPRPMCGVKSHAWVVFEEAVMALEAA